jgi:hypothetical protein
MVHSGVVTFDPYPFESTKNSYLGRSIGTSHEDQSYGRLYREQVRIMRPSKDVNIMQLQSQISTLTEKIQELALPKIG